MDTETSTSSFPTSKTRLLSNPTSSTTEPGRRDFDNKQVLHDLTCPNGFPLNGYNGFVSVTNGGRRCQKWTNPIPHSHNYNSSHFPRDSSMEEADSYCRPVGDDPLPWCYTHDHYVRRQYCYGHICGMEYATCGGIESSPSGHLTYLSKDFHEYGFNDNLRDCAWKIISPNSKAIQLDVHAIDGPSTTCDTTYLEIYETTLFYGTFCSNDTMPFIHQSVSNMLNLRFVTEVYNTWFNATYYQVIPMRGSSVLRPECDDIIDASYAIGTLMPPDRNGDGMYDIMDDCTWLFQALVHNRIRAEVLFMDIQFHQECVFDFLEIYERPTNHMHERAQIYGRYCGNATPTVISMSYLLNVRFHSDFEITGMGFTLSYHHVTRGWFTYPVRTRGGTEITFTTNVYDKRMGDTSDNGSLSSKDITKSVDTTMDVSHFITTTNRTSNDPAVPVSTEKFTSQSTYEYSDSSESSVGTTLSFVGPRLLMICQQLTAIAVQSK